MTTIWTEAQVDLTKLAAHLEKSGRSDVSLQDDGIHLTTAHGLYHRIAIDEDKKFLRLGSYLPTDKFRAREEKLELIQRFNRQLFLTSFALDSEDDVLIDYPICYEAGLIVDQFMILLARFASMLDFIVEHENVEGLIYFDQYGLRRESIAKTVSTIGLTTREKSFDLDESYPVGILLN